MIQQEGPGMGAGGVRHGAKEFSEFRAVSFSVLKHVF